MIEHNPYMERADVFSFGITMWELLTGRVPYEEMTPLQVRAPQTRPSCPIHPTFRGPHRRGAACTVALLTGAWIKHPTTADHG